ncbi:MAG: DUF2339 domain-containing protein [Bacteroidia bacterium]
MTNEEKINLIGQKMLILSNNLDKYRTELVQLQQQLDHLKAQQQGVPRQQIVPPVVKKPEVVEPVIEKKPEIIEDIKNEVVEKKPEIIEEIPVVNIRETIKPVMQQQYIPPVQKPRKEFNFEEFIGGKLITIIGIVILVIGLGIGVKYAIENDLLGPLARIVLAYAAGGILLIIAFRLKEKFKAFSAVLLSGGMASLYFTTFIAYSMYDMFPQVIAFVIMALFTIFTVYAAIIYNLQVIGIIGLVGAYAVPMLLSDGSGKIEIMFGYMTIVNIGILVLSFKKYWQVLNHVAFGFTWLIFFTWFATKYGENPRVALSMGFALIFFIIFYLSNMSYKILKQEKFGVLDIIRLVSNSFIFFGMGYATLNQTPGYEQYLGVFTVGNALIHCVFAYVVFKNKLLDRKLFYLLIALVLSFITIAVPVQLDGNWVTLFWSAEAVLLFSIGRYKAVRFYEWLGYAMILLGIFSLMQDWGNSYYTGMIFDNHRYAERTPFMNVAMLTSLFVIASMSTMIWIQSKKALTAEERKEFFIYNIIDYAMGIFLFLITYMTFSNEIALYYRTLYENSKQTIPSTDQWTEAGATEDIYDYSLLKLKDVVLGIYNVVFYIVFSLLAIYKLRSPAVRWSSFIFNMLIALIFITIGFSELHDLNEELYNGISAKYYTVNPLTPNLRYLCMALCVVLLYLSYKVLRTETFSRFTIAKIYSGSIIHFFILVMLSNEIIHLRGESDAVYKLGFTALWGLYSFALTAFGIFRKNKIMRVAAISLFGITLIKLVTFDTWDLSTGYKVIAYMLLGAILLVVAFLYQKFKNIIFGDDMTNTPQ